MKNKKSRGSPPSTQSFAAQQGNYEQMFGGGNIASAERGALVPEMLPVTYKLDVIRAAAEQAIKSKRWLLLFVVGTKPCFYKFYGSVVASRDIGLPYLVIDSGQHYDPLLTQGSSEFGLKDQYAANLNIRGDLSQKAGELYFKVSWLARFFSTNYPGLTVVPVVLGDTIMTSIVPAAWLFTRNEKAIQNEAGLRSMTATVLRDLAKNKNIDMARFFERQRQGPWERLTDEPFPEQYDTFTSAAGSRFLFAPTTLNRDHLLQEGYAPENIFVIGGVVMDALNLKLKEKPAKSIFQVFPALQRGKWIRMDIHRKENLTPRRFHAIVGAIKGLVQKGYQVNFVEMNATRLALEQYGLKNTLMSLQKKKNFLYTPVWPEYSQVIEFYKSEACLAALTDSGGLQEELNVLKKNSFTCRFNTDRPETVRQGGGNLLVPPIDATFMVKAMDFALKSPRLLDHPKRALYGDHVGRKFAETMLELMKRQERPFQWTHERLGFWKETAKRTIL